MKRRNKVTSPVVAEVLESRILLSAVSFNRGTVTVNGDNADNNITVTQDKAGNVLVDVDGEVTKVKSRVDKLVINGFKGDDVIQNRTNIDAFIFGGNGHDIIRGGGGDDQMFGGNGNDIINDFGGNNLLDGGNGNDTLQSVAGGADTFLGGNGNDSLYAIVGEPNIVLGGRGKDSFIVRQGVETTDARRNEQVVAFAGRVPGTLENGVLYVGLGTGGTTIINQVGKQLFVNINGNTFTYNVKDVDVIAGVGSPDNDIFINNSKVDSVYYGSAGDDLLVGGNGDDLLKGGSGDDIMLGRGGNDDLAGDPGRDVIFGGRGRDKIRVDDLDLFFATDKDLTIFQ